MTSKIPYPKTFEQVSLALFTAALSWPALVLADCELHKTRPTEPPPSSPQSANADANLATTSTLTSTTTAQPTASAMN